MKYWISEIPEVFTINTTQFRHFSEAAKLQIFRLSPKSAHGVTKGVTIDFASMSDDTFQYFAGVLRDILVVEARRRGLKVKEVVS